MKQEFYGCYQDIITECEGSVKWRNHWRPNLIVENCNTLLAMLMKRHEGTKGIHYCAIGIGQSSWDVNRPIPLLSDTQLTKELYRKSISPDDVVYLDEDGQPTGIPTNLLEIAVEFKGEDIVPNGSQPLREFGLFGGDASDNADSGYMINHVTHGRYDLTPELTLNRKIHLNFTGGVISQEELTGFGASFPVNSIDGVGDEYTSDLNAEGIQTLGDLVQIDPLVPVGNIPPIKLREFRAKVRMVMSLKATLAPFIQLADLTISHILIEWPENLANAIDSFDVTTEMATRLQEELSILQIALDDIQLQNIKLGDLMNI